MAEELTAVSDRLCRAFPLPETGAFTDLIAALDLAALDRRELVSELEGDDRDE